MKKIVKEFNIYKFNELKEESKDKVINNFIKELVEFTNFSKISKNSNLYKAYKQCEDLQTPWFIGNYIYDYCKKDILKKAKKYMYYENGNIYFE